MMIQFPYEVFYSDSSDGYYFHYAEETDQDTISYSGYESKGDAVENAVYVFLEHSDIEVVKHRLKTFIYGDLDEYLEDSELWRTWFPYAPGRTIFLSGDSSEIIMVTLAETDYIADLNYVFESIYGFSRKSEIEL